MIIINNVLVCHILQRTSQSSALAIGDLAVKLIHRDFNVWLTLGDGALQVLLDVRQQLGIIVKWRHNRF